LARNQCSSSENVLKLTYDNVWVKNVFIAGGLSSAPPKTIPVFVTEMFIGQKGKSNKQNIMTLVPATV